MGFHHVGQASLQLLTSGDPPASAFQSARITGMHHHTQLIFVFLVERGFHHVAQSGVELLASNYLPASASQSAGITGMNHRTWPCLKILSDQEVFLKLFLWRLQNKNISCIIFHS
uniref:Uncharacterized protein n=1 Tax=Callithrix jacchus TaxID=9483 RepID=A0A8I3W3U0_CALJA